MDAELLQQAEEVVLRALNVREAGVPLVREELLKPFRATDGLGHTGIEDDYVGRRKSVHG